MKTQKLNPTEKRAQAFCRSAVENGQTTLNVEWRKSRDYGYCPAVLNWNGEKIAYASGCGYDKLSAVLVEALSFLFPDCTDAGGSLRGCSGAGLSTVTRRLKEHGWTLEQTANGQTFDAFKLTRDACQECNGHGFITDPRSGGGKVYLPHPCHVCNAKRK